MNHTKPIKVHKYGALHTMLGLGSIVLLLLVYFVLAITLKADTATTASFQVEAGTKTGVTTISDALASGGSSIKFGAATAAGPQNCPPLPAYPDENCTGVLPGVPRTTFAANRTITQDGMVIENVNVTGWLIIDADNVVIRNMYLESNDFWPLRVNGQNVRIEDSTFVGGPNNQAPLAGTFHALRIDVSGSPDGVTIGNDSSLTDSYVHDLVTFEGAHNDGVNADGRLRTSIIHNTILNSNSQTSAMYVGNTEEPSNLIVRDNLLAGGGYTIYAGLGAGPGQGIRFENNVFSKRYFPRSGSYGPVAYWQNGNGNTWVNNRYEDGTPITP